MISGNKVNIRLFNSEDEVLSYFKSNNDLDERSILDHTELISPLKAVTRFREDNFWSKNSGRLAVADKSDRILGTIEFCVKTEMELAIGYRINRNEDRGKGYMGEALKLFSEYLFNTIPLITRLSLYTAEDNIPSRKIAEKSGYTLEGILRNAYFYRGKVCNWTLYSILREEV